MKENAEPTERRIGGAEFELEIFGVESKFDPDAPLDYLPFDDCMREANRVAAERKWKPHSPDPNLGITKLHKAVVALAKDRHPGMLSIFVWPCIGTRLDHVHGVDGYFMAKATSRAMKYVDKSYYLFDLSNYPHKRAKPNIDVLDRSCFEECLDETADRILTALWKVIS